MGVIITSPVEIDCRRVVSQRALRVGISIRLKDETEALKSLQER